MKRNFYLLLLFLLLVGGSSPLLPDSPAPMPASACLRFPLPAADQAEAPPTLADLPTVNRPARFAVHTLFVDQLILERAAALGADTIVQVLPWKDVNPRPGSFIWETADALVRETLAHNLHLVLRLDMPPAWASGADQNGLPFDLAAYADFVNATAARYRGHILGYIIWNEPNLAAEWSFSGQNLVHLYEVKAGRVAEPAAYAGLLGAAYRRIKAADPQALVIAAGLAPTNEISGRALDERLFLEQLLAAGAGDCFDILAVHDYGFGRDPWAPHEPDGLNLARILDLNEILERYAVGRPLWITELGYSLDSQSQPSVSPEAQAAYLSGSLERIEAEWPQVEVITLWNLSYGPAVDREMAGFSLLDEEGDPRPAYGDLQRWLSGRNNRTFTQSK